MEENFTSRIANIKDLEGLQALGRTTFYSTFGRFNKKEDMEEYLLQAFSLKQLRKEMGEEDSNFYLIEDRERLIGYMKLNFPSKGKEDRSKNSMEIQRIYILEDYQGKGLGKKLIEKAKKIGKNKDLDYIWLEVWKEDKGARTFYRRQGFSKIGERQVRFGKDIQTNNIMKYRLD